MNTAVWFQGSSDYWFLGVRQRNAWSTIPQRCFRRNKQLWAHIRRAPRYEGQSCCWNGHFLPNPERNWSWYPPWIGEGRQIVLFEIQLKISDIQNLRTLRLQMKTLKCTLVRLARSEEHSGGCITFSSSSLTCLNDIAVRSPVSRVFSASKIENNTR